MTVPNVQHFVSSILRRLRRLALLRLVLLRRSTTILLLQRSLAPTRRFEDLDDIVSQLRIRLCHILGENVSKGAEALHLAAHELITATNEFDKLSRVDVWVAAVFDVVDELGRDGGQDVGRRCGGVERLEGVGEGFAVVVC